MTTFLGDFAAGATVRFGFNTHAIAGESITIATDGAINVYKNGDTTQSVAGVTFTENFDGNTGAHLVTIVTSDGFYTAGADYMVMLSGATIDGKAVNAWIGHFSIANRPVQSFASAAILSIWAALTSALTTTGSIGAYILARLALIGSSAATVPTPMLANGNLSIEQGDSYDNTANTKLVFSDGGSWSASTPTSATLYVQQIGASANLLAVTGVVDWISATKTVTVTLTAANTDLLQYDKHDYQLVARFAGTPTPVQTLAKGVLTADLKEWVT